MARAAAGQERSPRPPSGSGAHGCGADLSQLASAARLSSIHLCGLPQRPLQEPEQSPPGLSESVRSGGEETARRAADPRAVRGPEGWLLAAEGSSR